ncbi:mtDNA inheritance, partitioning of the mitochondrial organelle [Salix suchowensis]|nr:mtDNA inheritance, partitioning of the mitochondrial organelle [Salix suchowensis]
MREILYIQAGSFANYTGTHFWNTQEEYFTYDDETEPLVNHDISFREGIDRRGIRRIALDYSCLMFGASLIPAFYMACIETTIGNFGSLSAAKSLYCHEDQSVGSSSQAEESIWDGDILAYKQEPISSTQPTKHDAPRVGSSPEARINNEVEDTQDGLKESLSKVSSWSDFARVSYIPRSIQKIPDSPDGTI